MSDQPVVSTSSDLGRLTFALEDRPEAFIVEYRNDEAMHGIATPTSVAWQPTAKMPAGGVEIADHLVGQERDTAVSEAEDKIVRSIFPGEDKPRGIPGR